MKTISTKPKRQRIYKTISYKRGDRKIHRPLLIQPLDSIWKFDIKIKDWVYTSEASLYYDNEYFIMSLDGLNNIYSLKAAIRLLKKWNVPTGTKFWVRLPFIGYDFIITKV